MTLHIQRPASMPMCEHLIGQGVKDQYVQILRRFKLYALYSKRMVVVEKKREEEGEEGRKGWCMEKASRPQPLQGTVHRLDCGLVECLGM